MSPCPDPVLRQYWRISGIELSMARGALLATGCGHGAASAVEALERVLDMATMLRHRRTERLIGLVLGVLDEQRLGYDDIDAVFDAVERVVSGGRADPRVVAELEAQPARL